MILLNASKAFTCQFLFYSFLLSVGVFAQVLSGKVIDEKPAMEFHLLPLPISIK